MNHSPNKTGLVVRSALKRVGREVTPPALLSTQAVGWDGPADGAAEVVGGLLFVLLLVAALLLAWVCTADPTCWKAF